MALMFADNSNMQEVNDAALEKLIAHHDAGLMEVVLNHAVKADAPSEPTQPSDTESSRRSSVTGRFRKTKAELLAEREQELKEKGRAGEEGGGERKAEMKGTFEKRG